MNDNNRPAFPKTYEEFICPSCHGTGETGPVRHPGVRCGACGGTGTIYVETDDDQGQILPATDY